MKNIIIYTKRYELKFDKEGTSQVDISDLMEKLSKDYLILDNNPSISIEEKYQYVTFRLCKKEGGKKIGF